jgi:glucose/arabinose dehydrogenase
MKLFLKWIICCALLAGCTLAQNAQSSSSPVTPISPTVPVVLATTTPTREPSTATAIVQSALQVPTVVQPQATVGPVNGITPVVDPGLTPVRLAVPEAGRPKILAQDHDLRVPSGFHVSVFASGLDTPRGLAVSPQGDLYVTLLNSGKVVALLDRKHSGFATEVTTFLEGLDHPHGIAFGAGWMYVGETGKVERARDTTGGLHADQRETIVPSLPNDGGHFTRTVHIGPDQKLYVSIGSSCNVCVEKSQLRATIIRYNLDGSGEHVFARGLRNAVGFTFSPTTGKLWAAVNGRDNLGDDLPGEDITEVSDGNNFGWPMCYGDRIPDPQLGNPRDCASMTSPTLQIQAHSAPLGALFYSGRQFPSEYRGDLFVPLHGSWNRSTPTGYKVVRVAMHDRNPAPVEDFVDGWLVGSSAWGRPVDIAQGIDGAIYVSDDQAGIVYRIWYQ